MTSFSRIGYLTLPMIRWFKNSELWLKGLCPVLSLWPSDQLDYESRGFYFSSCGRGRATRHLHQQFSTNFIIIKFVKKMLTPSFAEGLVPSFAEGQPYQYQQIL